MKLTTITAKELKTTREGLHLSQSEFAGLVGLTTKSLQNYEQGIAIVPRAVEAHIQTLQKLIKLHETWDVLPPAIMAVTIAENPISALNEVDRLADDHERAWSELFPDLPL